MKDGEYMDTVQFFTLLASIVGGFSWILARMDRLSDRIDKVAEQLNDIEKRLTVVETILQMMGYTIKPKASTEP
jgi:nicotinamide riboside transporter PnuC